MNFIPDRADRTLNYWCTFATQLLGQPITSIRPEDAEGPEGARIARDYLNEQVIFGETGWVKRVLPEVRNDLFFLFDDGWDVPYGLRSPESIHAFGSVMLSEERFPSFRGTQAERLRRLNEQVRESGWRGAGLWIAAQAQGERRDGPRLSNPAMEAYWRQRLRWSAEAGIDYWKVDWGTHEHDLDFRRLLTRLAHEEAPMLVVEHAYCCAPFNDVDGTGRFQGWPPVRNAMRELTTFSEVVRSYDVSVQLSAATSVDRLVDLLNNPQAAPTAIINAEDEVYLAAALGCAFGVMRSALWHEIEGLASDPRELKRREGEVIRAVRWQRIAPSFGIDSSIIRWSDEVLTDSWVFQRGDFWDTRVIGRAVTQTAPAIISRNMPLPKVGIATDKPFVVASSHPNGAIAVAALPHPTPQKTFVTPLVDVEIAVGSGKHPIGVFGAYRSLTLQAERTLQDVNVWAQDLAGDEAIDISEEVGRSERSITLPGELITKIGWSVSYAGDKSDPGLLLVLG
jgi:hypothetical protein